MIIIGNRSFADVEIAISELRPAVEAAPGDVVGLKTLAEAHALGGQVEEALELYVRATSKSAGAQGLRRVGELLMRSGQAHRAEDSFDRAIQLGGFHGSWLERTAKDYCELADLYFAESDLESALRCHDKVSEIFPDYQDSKAAALLKKHIHAVNENVAGVIPSAAADGPTCHAALVIWGADYCRFFIDICLPSLLSPGNLLALAARERIIFCVYATAEAIRIIDESTPFQRLKNNMEILFIEIPETVLELTRADWIDQAARYRNTLRIVTAHHYMATRIAKQKQAAVLYIIPDWVVSEGCFERMHDITKTGKDICVFPVLVGNRDSLTPQLAELKLEADGVIAISAERLCRLAVQNLHPSWDQFFAGDDEFQAYQFPAWMMWRFEDCGLILHTFHWSPIYVTKRGLEDYRGKRYWTIDHRFLDAMLPSEADWDRVAICNKTNEHLIVAVSEAETDYAWAADEKSAWGLQQIVAFAQPGLDELSLSKGNHLLFKERVIFNANGDNTQLIDAEKRADKFIAAITEKIVDVSLLWA